MSPKEHQPVDGGEAIEERRCIKGKHGFEQALASADVAPAPRQSEESTVMSGLLTALWTAAFAFEQLFLQYNIFRRAARSESLFLVTHASDITRMMTSMPPNSSNDFPGGPWRAHPGPRRSSERTIWGRSDRRPRAHSLRRTAPSFRIGRSERASGSDP